MLAAVVLDSLAAPLDPELDLAIGPGAAQRLRRELRAATRRWAAALAPGHAFEASSADAAVLALDGHVGPAVFVAPDVPALGPAHARAVLAELGAGTGVAIGTAHDGLPYLVMLAQSDPDQLALVAGGWEALVAAASERGLELAMLRAERRLTQPADARALALDPLAPAALVAQLGNLRPRRRESQ